MYVLNDQPLQYYFTDLSGAHVYTCIHNYLTTTIIIFIIIIFFSMETLLLYGKDGVADYV